MNKFLIVANTDKDINLKLSQDIVAYIREKGAQAVVVSDEQHYNGTTIKPEYMGGVEAVIVLGGDGTMLRAAHSIGTYDVPLMGVNLGTLGFLTEVEESNAYKGVIVATPTGSTGYNLSAGGPIISPKSKAVVVTPISPHSLTSKSVVFDSADRIRIEVVKKRRTQETEAIVSFDGADNIELSAGESVEVTCSKREIRLIKMYDVSFYSVLREKIGGA